MQLRAVPSSLGQIQSSGVSSISNLSNLPPGTTILSSGNSGSGQGFALVPTLLSQVCMLQDCHVEQTQSDSAKLIRVKE